MIWSCCVPETEPALLPAWPHTEAAMRRTFLSVSLIAGVLPLPHKALLITINFIVSIIKMLQRWLVNAADFYTTAFDKSVSF